MPDDDDVAVCQVCDQLCYYWEAVVWNGTDFDVTDAHWSHVTHPVDEHDAVPVPEIDDA